MIDNDSNSSAETMHKPVLGRWPKRSLY